MKYFKFLIPLLFISVCFAQDIDKPRVLIRKADNKVCGIGYTNFDGISDKNAYEVKILKDRSEVDQATQDLEGNKQNEKQKEQVIKDKKEQDRQSALNKLQALGLTKEETEALK